MTARYYFLLGKIENRHAVASLSQVRLFDTRRLIRKIGTLEEDAFRELAKELAPHLFPFLSPKQFLNLSGSSYQGAMIQILP